MGMKLIYALCMIRHKEIYFSDFSCRQVYALVEDVESYPEFLPWCSAARIIKTEKNIIIAELVIHFASMHENYTSRITLSPPEEETSKCKIDVQLIEGPFRTLENHWYFEFDKEKKQTKITFDIAFEFQSTILQKIIGFMFEAALMKMMKSFEGRAKEIYCD
jgi:coenzyme Q-binding protein COQ10